jgi:eukaryotic-like serine/threonine-protein kinase
VAEETFAAGLVGIVLDGRYRLDALLGEGGMGAVYRAHHLAMDRRVAVKLLKPHLTTDEAALNRFAREARATMRVESEHAVKVLDFGVTPHRDYYMVLEYLDGRTVQRELDIDGPFEPARVVHIAKQACDALGAAHKSGLIHRDIKPDNLLLMRVADDPDYVKVLDFGVAKLMEGAARTDRSAMAITQAGMVFGTPEFMSPEQACGQQLDARSDLYSLAATMFAMLTGCGMYRAKSAIEWLTHHARTPPPHLAEGAPALAKYKELDTVLQSCLAKHREDRPQTGAEMAQMLAAIEHTLGKGRAPLPVMRGPTFSPSTYIEAIDPNATLVPDASGLGPRASARRPASDPKAETLKPGDDVSMPSGPAYAATMKPSDGMMAIGSPPSVTTTKLRPTSTGALGPTTTGMIAHAQTSRRGMWLVLGALLVAALIVVSIVLATRKREPTTTTPLAKHTDVAIDGEPIDAIAIVALASDAPTVDAPGAVKPDARGPTEARGPRPEAKEVAKLIAEAEEAKKARNLVRWVMKADAALQLEPRNVRARFLLADGLIASGDLDRGCKYLHDLGKNPTARARANQAGCPSD